MTQTSDAGPGPGPAPPTERSDRAAALAARRRLRRRNTAIAVVFALVLCLFAAVTAVNALTDIGPFTAPPERTVDTAAAPPAEVVAPPVDGAAPAAPAPAPAPVPAPPPPPPVAFSTPTGNIGCSLTPDGARCDIVDRAWDPGPPPADCAATWGAGVQVGPQGAGLVCAADSVLGTAAPLDYGAVSEVGTFRCTSTEAGVRCEDLATGRGFALARTSYTLF